MIKLIFNPILINILQTRRHWWEFRNSSRVHKFLIKYKKIFPYFSDLLLFFIQTRFSAINFTPEMYIYGRIFFVLSSLQIQKKISNYSHNFLHIHLFFFTLKSIIFGKKFLQLKLNSTKLQDDPEKGRISILDQYCSEANFPQVSRKKRTFILHGKWKKRPLAFKY